MEDPTQKHSFTYPMDFKIYNMKKLLFILFTLLMTHGFYSQGNNLQFNQVLNYDYEKNSGASYAWHNVGTITVSANKVMKITSASTYVINVQGNNYISTSAIKVGEQIIHSRLTNIGTEGNLPTWLSQGTYNVYLYSTSATSSIKGSLSIVEFNIVQ